MNVFRSVVVVAIAFLAVACTHIKEIRATHTSAPHSEVDVSGPDFECRIGDVTPGEYTNSIEDYGKYFLGVVEFDDQGWSYDQSNQMQVLESRLKQEFADPQYDDTDFLTVVFIHGWHHNAHDNDCNVYEFRSMLKSISEKYDSLYPGTFKQRKRVVGIYVGWRGEAMNIPGIRYLSIVDRRYTAEHVAKGSVRELFAMLRKHEFVEGARSKRPDRVRTVVIGHSFGGLIAFHGLSQALLNELALSKPDPNIGCNSAVPREGSTTSIPAWPDMVVLINPAFEASRFESLHHLMQPVKDCPYLNETRPKLVVVTADNDSATGSFFPFFRRIGTLFEGYDESIRRSESRERESNWHAIGFVDRYRTHRLCLQTSGSGQTRAVAALAPPASADWKQDEFAPVWVIGAPPEIVDGHDGFLYARKSGTSPQPYLLEWLIDLHAIGPKPPVMAAAGSCGGWDSK